MPSRQPAFSMPIEEFLKPIFVAYERNGIKISLSKVENNIVYISVDKKICAG